MKLVLMLIFAGLVGIALADNSGKRSTRRSSRAPKPKKEVVRTPEQTKCAADSDRILQEWNQRKKSEQKAIADLKSYEAFMVFVAGEQRRHLLDDDSRSSELAFWKVVATILATVLVVYVLATVVPFREIWKLLKQRAESAAKALKREEADPNELTDPLAVEELKLNKVKTGSLRRLWNPWQRRWF